MKTIKHEIKLEKSVKIIFAILAVGVFLNAFATPIGQELFSIKDANAATQTWPNTGTDKDKFVCLSVQGPIHRITLCDGYNQCGYVG